MTNEEELVKKLWDWIDRPVDPDFWKTAGNMSKEEYQKRWNEIPAEFKPLAYSIIQLAIGNHKHGGGGKSDHACLIFRIMLFDFVNQIKEKGIDLPLPSYWFTDGIMIEPEWIVKITNGLIGWVCDNSNAYCGLYGKCRYSD